MKHRYGRRPGDTLTERVRGRVQKLIDESGLTQVDLAARLGVDQAYLSRFRTGQMQNPPLEFLDALSNLFNYNLADILGEVLEPRDPIAANGPLEQDVLEHYRALDPDAQALIRRHLALFAQLSRAPHLQGDAGSGSDRGPTAERKRKARNKRLGPPPPRSRN